MPEIPIQISCRSAVRFLYLLGRSFLWGGSVFFLSDCLESSAAGFAHRRHSSPHTPAPWQGWRPVSARGADIISGYQFYWLNFTLNVRGCGEQLCTCGPRRALRLDLPEMLQPRGGSLFIFVRDHQADQHIIQSFFGQTRIGPARAADRTQKLNCWKDGW